VRRRLNHAGVFVYGTLAPGHLRWPIVEPFVDRHDEAMVAGLLLDTGLGYPAAMFSPVPGSGRPVAQPVEVVRGRVLHLHEATVGSALRLLDTIEGPGYRRVEVTTTDGCRCWSYEWRGTVDGLTVIADGRWTGAES
jgi:gamma-glutamylcyclotransferase (GGCT)/AIG2-like uncharacterized protein YtfP